MADLIARRALSLAGGAAVSARVPLDPQTDTLVVRLARPTTAAPRAWDAASTLEVAIVVTLDGVEHRCTGRVTGGIRRAGGRELPEYQLTYRPQWGFFGDRTRPPRRLGESRQGAYTAHVEVTHLTGPPVVTEIEASSTAAPVRAVR